MAKLVIETREMECTNNACTHTETQELWRVPVNEVTFQVDHKAKVLCPKCGFKCLAEKQIEIDNKILTFGLGDK
jgi:hypothetical protein